MTDQIINTTEGTSHSADVDTQYGACRYLSVNGANVLQQEVTIYYADGGIEQVWRDVPTLTA